MPSARRVVAFRNKVDDFIDPTFDRLPGPAPFGSFQYLNISQATLEGIELEAMYDARNVVRWASAAHHIRGTNEDTGEGLYSSTRRSGDA